MSEDTIATGAEIAALADEVRRLVGAVRTADAPREVLAAAGALVAEATALLEPHRWPGPYAQGSLRGDAGPLGQPGVAPADFFPYSPVIGPRNPVAPPAVFEPQPDGAVTGWFHGAPAYNGPPGFVHGGVIAMVFDELLGVVGVVQGAGAMTGTLTIRYRRPTPIERRVDLHAWLDRVEGRKVFIRGDMRVDGEVTAEAEGVFIRVAFLEGMPVSPPA
jgi:acyl-coenzyme A thioesterase PaaI-like protein